MQASELWNQFVTEHPEYKNKSYEAWNYGVDPDELAHLTKDGTKTATTSGHELYALEGEELPKENEYSVILDSNNQAVCITKTTRVYVVPFNEVTADHAFKEGEGDRTLAYWKKVHTDFFVNEYKQSNTIFKEDSLVVCEEFEVIY